VSLGFPLTSPASGRIEGAASAGVGPDAEGPASVLHRSWWCFSLLVLALFIGVRWLRYLPVSWPPALDHLLGGLMIWVTQLFAWPFVLTTLVPRFALIGGVLAALLFHRRLVRRVGTVWRFTPLLVSLLCGAMLWLHYLFDLSPFVASLCLVSLLLAWPRERRPIAGGASARLLALGWVAFFGFWLWHAGDFAERAAVGFWAVTLFATRRYGPRFLGVREQRLLLVLAVIPANLLSCLLPLVLPWHGGTRFGDGMAYDFCEVPKRGVLLASVPACGAVINGYADCGRGQVVAYDAATLERLTAYSFFSPGYYGRLEELVCLEDEIHVGVQSTRYRGRLAGPTSMSFPLDAPERFKPLMAGRAAGSNIVYDPHHDALFYTDEYTHRIVRYDRRTGQYDERVGEPFRRRWFHPLFRTPQTGSFLMPSSAIDPRRDRIFPVEAIQGRYAYAVDTGTLRPVARYDVEGGGGVGAAVDSERGRLFVASFWGMEVFDIASGKLIARKRLSLHSRPVTVDPVRNRLYVSSEIEGKIRILDRDTLAVIGQIPIGMGSRYVHLSADGTRLFASSYAGQYYWDADTLSPRR
jgi:hypothetical protein